MTLLRWLTFLLRSLTGTFTGLLFSISFDASICSTMAFPLSGNSDHMVVSISIDFPSNAKRNATFHYVAYDYSHVDWDGLRDHLKDVL